MSTKKSKLPSNGNEKKRNDKRTNDPKRNDKNGSVWNRSVKLKRNVKIENDENEIDKNRRHESFKPLRGGPSVEQESATCC